MTRQCIKNCFSQLQIVSYSPIFECRPFPHPLQEPETFWSNYTLHARRLLWKMLGYRLFRSYLYLHSLWEGKQWYIKFFLLIFFYFWVIYIYIFKYCKLVKRFCMYIGKTLRWCQDFASLTEGSSSQIRIVINFNVKSKRTGAYKAL